MPTETDTVITTFEQAADKAREDLKVDPTPEPSTHSEPEVTTKEPEKVETKVEAPEAAPGPTIEETAEDSLLSAEAVKKLSPGDRKTYNEMQKAFTQKTQAIAAERKKIENLVRINEAFERDPKGTLKLLAEQQGLKFVEPTPEITAPVAEKSLTEELREDLGPELDVLADKLGPFLDKIQKRLDSQLEKRIQPIAQQNIAATAAKQMDAIMAKFKVTHSDFDRYEPRMNALMKKVLPGVDATESEYLEHLYQLASGPEKAVVEALSANAKAAAANEPLVPGGVSPEKVAPVMPKGLSFGESFERAAELARQGITLPR